MSGQRSASRITHHTSPDGDGLNRAATIYDSDNYSRIDWVDDYLRRIAPFIHVREHDSVLIKIPNQAYKLNPSGIGILKSMLSGTSAREIASRQRDSARAANDIHDFFCDLRALMKGCLSEHESRRTVEKRPFELFHTALPVLSEIAITYRCNLDCSFCYAGCSGVAPVRDELSTAEWKRIIELIRREAEVPSISFTGGEPCTRGDLVELVAHAKSLGMWTNLITNGTLVTDELAAALKRAGLDSAQVSIEGGAAELHDRITARPGSFERAVCGIGNLKKLGVRIHTNSTICGLNRGRLDGIVDLSVVLGMERLSMNLLMPCGSSKANLAELLVRYDEIGPIVLATRDYAEKRGVEFMWYSPTPVCVFNPVEHGLGNKGCAACDGLLSVAANGDVLPCSSYDRPVGNMLAWGTDFRGRWESDLPLFFRKKEFAHEKCRSCEDLAMCNGGCPLYWAKVGYGELEGRRCQ